MRQLRLFESFPKACAWSGPALSGRRSGGAVRGRGAGMATQHPLP
jgi:hypothetical protein